jgi:predicted GNAT family acetyltransferase
MTPTCQTVSDVFVHLGVFSYEHADIMRTFTVPFCSCQSEREKERERNKKRK